MEELDNIEGIGMDREETPKPKKKRIAKKPKPITSAKLNTVDKVKMFWKRCDGNANKLAAQIGVSKSVIEQIIRDENL